MTDSTLVTLAEDLANIPLNWPTTRERATSAVILSMAKEIERLQRIVNRICPDKSDDI